MNKKQKTTYGSILAAVLIIIVIWFVSSKPESGKPSTGSQNGSKGSTSSPSPSPSGQPSGSEGNVWKGTLKTSDNSAKGNLMLVTPDHTIYIKTSRDFSSLIGKQVVVAYQGSLDGFTLTNISAE